MSPIPPLANEPHLLRHWSQLAGSGATSSTATPTSQSGGHDKFRRNCRVHLGTTFVNGHMDPRVTVEIVRPCNASQTWSPGARACRSSRTPSCFFPEMKDSSGCSGSRVSEKSEEQTMALLLLQCFTYPSHPGAPWDFRWI